jgi:hypothetical protein
LQSFACRSNKHSTAVHIAARSCPRAAGVDIDRICANTNKHAKQHNAFDDDFVEFGCVEKMVYEIRSSLFAGAHIMIATGGVIGQANADSLLVYNGTIAANIGGQQPYCETHVRFVWEYCEHSLLLVAR